MPHLISVVIPVHNEELNLHELYYRLSNTLKSMDIRYEYIFVNDGSTDNSLSIIKCLSQNDRQVKYIDLSRNFGHQVAISAGLDNVEGDFVIIIDADLQDSPELILDMYKKIQGGFEVVYAIRKERKGEGLGKRLTAKLFYRLLNKLSSTNIPVDTGDFRMIDRKVVDVICKMPEQDKYIRGQIAWVGFRQTYIEYEREERHRGKTKYTYSKMFRLAVDGITSFSDTPLKFATILGFIVSGLSLFIMLYAFYSRFVSKDYVPGWTSLMISVLFLGGVQLLSLGIIGEYIGRIAANVRNRPLYVINETNTLKTTMGIVNRREGQEDNIMPLSVGTKAVLENFMI